MDKAPRATLGSGTVEGLGEGDLSVFRGIPFAAAPFGPLRFKAPVPARHWDGVRDASRYGPPPPQTVRLAGAGDQPRQPDDADCLTVNVWSPDLAGPLPVMVWIYGGGYLAGHAGQPRFDGASLARRGVVLVTFNHRVGADGFAELRGAPANRGLLDQVAALEWVQENIAAFGGDPGRVTVFGESAGAGSIAALLAMPRARGLFRSAALQSVPCTFFTAALADEIGSVLAAHVGRGATLDELAELSTDELIAATRALIEELPRHLDDWGQVALTITPFSPVVDGDVLACSPWEALGAGAAAGTDLMVGWCREEYQSFLVRDGRLEGADDTLSATTPSALGPAPDPVTTYRSAYPDASPGRLIERVYSDWLFRIGTSRLAELHASSGANAFAYELAFSAPVEGGVLGACHGLDVPLVFNNLTGEDASRVLGEAPGDDVIALSRRMGDAWVRFATDGDPDWPRFDLERLETQSFDTADRVIADPDSASRALWTAHRFDAIDLPAS